MDIITLYLKLAFREPGCPICRLRQESEQRYLFNLLYESVNDGITRLHLVRGMGFCPEHAWALQATEQQQWNDGMGTGIIYEDLTGRVLDVLSGYLVESNSMWHKSMSWLLGHPFGLGRLREWLERRGRVGRQLAGHLPPPAPAESLLARLSPSEGCRVCEIGDWSEETNLVWLVRESAAPEFRTWYQDSDGLCLPHLRRALAHAKDEETVRFLVKVAADKLTPLLADLKEYGRKHSWEYRNEPKYPWEQASWVRAVAFFAGEAGEEDTRNDERRRQALADYRARDVD